MTAAPPPAQVTCCIVGGGPAGIMLGFLLARTGVAVAVLVGDEARVTTSHFFGQREQVKFQAAQSALNMLRLMLI